MISTNIRIQQTPAFRTTIFNQHDRIPRVSPMESPGSPTRGIRNPSIPTADCEYKPPAQPSNPKTSSPPTSCWSDRASNTGLPKNSPCALACDSCARNNLQAPRIRLVKLQPGAIGMNYLNQICQRMAPGNKPPCKLNPMIREFLRGNCQRILTEIDDPNHLADPLNHPATISANLASPLNGITNTNVPIVQSRKVST